MIIEKIQDQSRIQNLNLQPSSVSTTPVKDSQQDSDAAIISRLEKVNSDNLEMLQIQEQYNTLQNEENTLNDLSSRLETVKEVIVEEDGKKPSAEISSILSEVEKIIDTTTIQRENLVLPGKFHAAVLSDGIISKRGYEQFASEIQKSLSEVQDEKSATEKELNRASVAFENSLAAYSVTDFKQAEKLATITAEQIKNGTGLSSVFTLNSQRVSDLLNF